MQQFVRVVKLTNIGGRADYISNPDRQEYIVIVSSSIDWDPYQEFERSHQKTNTPNNEGREVIIALPNEWDKLPSADLQNKVNTLAEIAAGKSTDLQWAVHWNKDKTNLHLHVIFSERQKTQDAGTYDRDVYLTDEGKVARSKKDRAKDDFGEDKPPVHYKGEDKGGFTAKDTRYKEKKWIPEMKQAVKEEMTRQGVSIDERNPLSQFHQGKGKESFLIAQKNAVIRENNERLGVLTSHDPVQAENAKSKIVQELKERKVPLIGSNDTGLVIYSMDVSRIAILLALVKQRNKFIDAIKRLFGKDVERQDAPIGKPEPEPTPAFSMTEILNAGREYYIQTLALQERRTPEELAIVTAPANCRTALKTFVESHEQYRSAKYERERYKLPFFNKAEKLAAENEMRKAARTCLDSFETLVKYGVSKYLDSMEIRPLSMSSEEMNAIKHRAEQEIKRLQRTADHESRFMPPAPHGSQEAQKAAKTRFDELSNKVPSEYIEATNRSLNDVWEALNTDIRQFTSSSLTKIREMGQKLREDRTVQPTRDRSYQDRGVER